VISAPGAAHRRGAAYVFHVYGAGSWSSSDTPTARLRSKTGHTGFSVALSADGTTAFLGSPSAGGSDNPPGAIYVFHVSAEDAWVSSTTPAATLTVSGSAHLGIALAVS